MAMINIVFPPSSTTRSDPRLIERLIRALRDHPETSQAIRPAPAGGPSFVRLDDLGGQPAPPGTPLLNEAIGVLSVPAPAGGAAVVEAALRGIAPEGTRIQAGIEMGIPGGETPR